MRARLDASEKLATLKAQVRTLLKRNGVGNLSQAYKGWTRALTASLRGLFGSRSPIGYGARVALASLLRQKEALDQEIDLLDRQVEALAGTARYAEPAHAMQQEKGVGLLTAMVFLTEMGDLSRFANRKQIGAYLGLAPSSDETGESGERKGHITHQGPWRVRRALCQATWSRVRTDPAEKAVYERTALKNPKHKKIAVVAAMRRLAVLLWHIGRDSQRRHGCLDLTAEAAPPHGGFTLKGIHPEGRARVA